jgi:peroxiredoxin
MTNTRLICTSLACTLLTAGPTAPGVVEAQQKEVPKRDAKKVEDPGARVPESIDSINRDFEKELMRLERQRLERLAQLAAGQGKEAANKTYEAYFQLAIGSRLYRDAEPTAERVLGADNPSSQVVGMAALVNIIAEADRGAFDESLASLAAAFGRAGRPADGAAARPKVSLPRATRLLLAEAYYQRLIQADRFDYVRQALRMIQEKTEDAEIKEYAATRMRQLDLIGKPAPAIAGSDIDGKAIRLADFKGDVVLILFWATWYAPAAQDVAALDRTYESYRQRGFRVLGVNLDTAQEGGEKVDTVLPNIRRFLLDHNVRWPNLINGTGDRDHAKAYGVNELPANVLIGRDGTVIHRDLTRSSVERVVAKALGQ